MAEGSVRFGAGIRAIGNAFRRSLAFILQPIFGSWSWEPPGWLQFLSNKFAAMGGWLRARPRVAALGLAVIAAIAAGSYAGWQWWEAQPKPVLVTYKITEPGPLRLEDTDPKPEPLVIEFMASVAPLKDVGKEVSAGIALDPKLEGRWQWDGDKVLRFNPKSDWPVGGEFTLTLQRGLALAEQVRLADYRIRFKSAPSFGQADRGEVLPGSGRSRGEKGHRHRQLQPSGRHGRFRKARHAAPRADRAKASSAWAARPRHSRSATTNGSSTPSSIPSRWRFPQSRRHSRCWSMPGRAPRAAGRRWPTRSRVRCPFRGSTASP